MILKTKNLITKNCTIKNWLILFLIVQPIFDLKLFYSSVSTLIRIFFVILFFLYYFIKSKNKYKYLLSIYPLLITIYFIFHHINALHFHSLIPGNFNYSIFKEILYFIKMFCPYMLIYSLFKANFSKKDLFFIVKILVLEISLVIIISNLFLFSYGTYSDAKIKANFFEWFNSNSIYTYQDLTSKGLFEMANQISAVLLMLLPFMLLLNLEKTNKLNLFTLFSNIYSLILLGTKVAVFGIFLVFIYTTIMYIILKKQLKKTFVLTPFILIYVFLLPFNPTFLRINEHQKILETSSNAIVLEESNISTNHTDITLQNDTENTNDYKKNYILEHYSQNKINENFIFNRYPYEYDTDFWFEILKSENPSKSDYRFLEEAMVKRVLSINNNKFDILLGITYTRIQNIFNIEKDFVMQYYSLGILGLILVFAPYFIIILCWAIKMFHSKFKKLELFCSITFITVCMIFCIAYYSGNLLNSLGFVIYLSVIIHTLILTSKNGC